MSKWTDMGNNAITTIPTVDSKGRLLDWNANQKRSYRRAKAKSWARAVRKIPNFKTMKPEQIDAWHDAEAAAGAKVLELEAHLKNKNKAAKKTRSRRSA